MARDTIASLKRDLAAEQAKRVTADAEWQKKWDDLWEALFQKADENGWCSEFDNFAEENGGPQEEYQVTFTVKRGGRGGGHADDVAYDAKDMVGRYFDDNARETVDVIKVTR